MTKVGRNASCPCGSGKKAKRCCFGVIQGGQGNPADALAEEILAEAEDQGQAFGSLKELQWFTDRLVRQRNQRPRREFHGLSPEQMHRLLNFPFDSPEVVSFADPVEGPVDAPATILFQAIARHLEGKGIKPTARGNLPRVVVADALAAYDGRGTWSHDYYRSFDAFRILNEQDFADLEKIRIAAQLGGIIRKYRGRLILGREVRKLLADGGIGAVYPRLLRTYAERFNWAYGSRYPVELEFLQHSFGFTLYLLHRFGDRERPAKFYEDAFLKAFPQIVHEVPEAVYFGPETTVRHMYQHLVLEKFAEMFGLVRLEHDGKTVFERSFRVRKTPLLDRVVRFRV